MSRASMVVKLADGTVRYGIYNGTVDVCWEPLFDTLNEAWDAWQRYYGRDGDWVMPDMPDAPEQDALIYSDYGGGWWWEGRATYNRVVGPRDWDEFYDLMHDEVPDWAAQALGREGS